MYSMDHEIVTMSALPEGIAESCNLLEDMFVPHDRGRSRLLLHSTCCISFDDKGSGVEQPHQTKEALEGHPAFQQGWVYRSKKAIMLARRYACLRILGGLYSSSFMMGHKAGAVQAVKGTQACTPPGQHSAPSCGSLKSLINQCIHCPRFVAADAKSSWQP